MRKGKLWVKFKAGLRNWVVRLVPESADEMLTDTHGVTIFDDHLILMNRETEMGRSPLTLWHEVNHVAMHCSGNRDLLFKSFGVHESRFDEFEEAIIKMNESMFYIMHENKWLKLPKCPK